MVLQLIRGLLIIGIVGIVGNWDGIAINLDLQSHLYFGEMKEKYFELHLMI